eukprot:357325-Chlamydomonas_euryale.AAC.1
MRGQAWAQDAWADPGAGCVGRPGRRMHGQAWAGSRTGWASMSNAARAGLHRGWPCSVWVSIPINVRYGSVFQ